jgi:hypothetical protein
MNSSERNLTEIVVFRLVLGRHEDEEDSFKEFHLSKGREAHVEEDSIQDRHRHMLQEWGQEDGETHSPKNHDIGNSLLSNTEECWFLAGGG